MHDYTVLLERPDGSTFPLTFSTLPQARKLFQFYERANLSTLYDAVYLMYNDRILDSFLYVLPF